MSKKSVKIWYWITTIIFAAFMLFSGFSELSGNEAGNQLLIQLGYPLYLNIILGTAKILGAVAIIQTKWRTIKEWAYAGFAIDIIGASMSFAFIGESISNILMPLVFLAVMFVSYGLWKKSSRSTF
jgi:hypothetical protein